MVICFIYENIMSILFLMIISSIFLGFVFLIIFIFSVKNGQFDEDNSPAIRLLIEQ
jgi:cbb3-type cytochrome oxidase maturation protein